MMNGLRRWVMFILGIILLVVLFFTAKATLFGYILHNVPAGEIAVQMRSNRVIDVVGEGVYQDLDWFADIANVDVSVLRWCAFDSEVITKGDSSSAGQRIGVVVCGTVQRPGLDKKDKYLEKNAKLWSDYKQYFTDNKFLIGEFSENTNDKGDTVVSIRTAGLMQSLAQQGMKVCVGERTFAEAAVGNKRDDLASCIEDELEGRASAYGGIVVSNVTVPNIVLTETAKAMLDTITTSQLETERLAQDAKKVLAQGAVNMAEQQAQIMVEQGKIQETERQKAITAKLEISRLEAEKGVINATASNKLLEAEKSLAVNQALYEANILKAKADRADEVYYAKIIQDNPGYLSLLVADKWADVIKPTDKIIPVGSNPYTIINPWPNGSNPSVVLPQQTPQQ